MECTFGVGNLESNKVGRNMIPLALVHGHGRTTLSRLIRPNIAICQGLETNDRTGQTKPRTKASPKTSPANYDQPKARETRDRTRNTQPNPKKKKKHPNPPNATHKYHSQHRSTHATANQAPHSSKPTQYNTHNIQPHPTQPNSTNPTKPDRIQRNPTQPNPAQPNSTQPNLTQSNPTQPSPAQQTPNQHHKTNQATSPRRRPNPCRPPMSPALQLRSCSVFLTVCSLVFLTLCFAPRSFMYPYYAPPLFLALSLALLILPFLHPLLALLLLLLCSCSAPALIAASPSASRSSFGNPPSLYLSLPLSLSRYPSRFPP